MNTPEAELDRFKSQINLSEYAVNLGYRIDRRQSSRNSVVMRHDNGDKVIIAKAENGHYIYFSVRDTSDNGTIIDFVQYRTQLNLGAIRKTLRPWIGASPPPQNTRYYQAKIATTAKDREGVIRGFAAMEPAVGHAYLNDRGLGDDVLQHERFAGRVFQDERGNAVFPHFDETGLCGYEIKNENFTGFARGGIKALWLSHFFPKDTDLVITESAIEALSHFAVHRDPAARYLSVGGSWSEEGGRLVLKALAEFPGKRVKLAFNNDEGGKHMVKDLTKAIGNEASLSRLEVFPHLPATRGFDWNDVLTKGA
jgi:hypothetical protein